MIKKVELIEVFNSLDAWACRSADLTGGLLL